MSYEFCSQFHTLSSSAKILKILRLDKVTESSKLGTFLRHSVDCRQQSSATSSEAGGWSGKRRPA